MGFTIHILAARPTLLNWVGHGSKHIPIKKPVHAHPFSIFSLRREVILKKMREREGGKQIKKMKNTDFIGFIELWEQQRKLSEIHGRDKPLASLQTSRTPSSKIVRFFFVSIENFKLSPNLSIFSRSFLKF